MLSLLVVFVAIGLNAADDKIVGAPKSAAVVRPEGGPVTRMPEHLAPEEFFNSSKRLNAPIAAPRAPVTQRTPAEQEEMDRKKNWMLQSPEEMIGGLKFDSRSGKKGLGFDKDSDRRSINGNTRFQLEDSIESPGSISSEPPRNRNKVGESSAPGIASRPEPVPGEMNFEALLKKSSSFDRLGTGGGLSGSRPDNFGFQFDARQKEQRDIRMNEVRQLFNSTTVRPVAGTGPRNGLDSPALDPLGNRFPRSAQEPSLPAVPQFGSQDPRFRPTQTGVNHLLAPEVADPRNPAAIPSSSSSTVGGSSPERPKQQPTVLPFPKRSF